jgi:protein-tyrosine phosphatase
MYSFKKEDSIYDWISCTLKDKIYFGPFPNQNMIDKLIEEKFDIIVNLTMENENIYQNSTEEKNTEIYKIPKNMYISYQIKDNDIPECPLSYSSFISKIYNLYKKDKKIYIHCRGGHGRSGMVSVSLMLNIYPNKNIKEIIDTVNKSHIERIILRSKWKKKNAPFNYTQYLFLLKVHKNIYINNNNKYYGWLIFNEPFVYKNIKFYNIYNFFINNNLDSKEKLDFITNYFKEKISSNKEIEYKLHLTYLKRIILTDCDNEDFCFMYTNTIYSIRDSYFLKL